MRKNSDTDVKQNVLDELNWEPGLDATDIEVTVEKGKVTLVGTVKTYFEKFTARDAVLRVSGVNDVTNELSVELTRAYERSDDFIEDAALDVLARDTTIPEDKINVSVKDGWVTLEGRVAWNYQKLKATDAVGFVAGVKGVKNNITLEPTEKFERSTERIEKALKRSALVNAENIQVSIDGNNAVLSGTVSNWPEKREAEKIAWSTPGIFEIENNIVVRKEEIED